MDKLRDYNIAFKGLKDGKHQFHYSIDQSFFDAIEESAIKNGDFEVDVTMNKNSQMLQLDFNIDGNVQSVCDNCLGEVTVPIQYTGTMYIKFGLVYDEPSEEIIVLPYEENDFNVAQLIYELITVSMPLRSVHEDYEKCDPEMTAKLEEFSAGHHEANDNTEEAIDPRWAALKKLKDNNNK
ncbi:MULTISPECIES: YceD family protein [unclassified Saccharicrinis]|uniref:YceD family protein n=1 Tax=unclassified Saccharicrinis TaxID=2646859 RepID=UPI003D3573B4